MPPDNSTRIERAAEIIYPHITTNRYADWDDLDDDSDDRSVCINAAVDLENHGLLA